MMTIPELDAYIGTHIQGGFGQADMAVLKEEIEKLSPDDLYVEIGVDEGRSARVAHEYNPDCWKLFIDIHDPSANPAMDSRSDFMEKEGMVGLGKKEFYIHGDADMFADGIANFHVALLFIDGHHGYDDVKKNTLKWEPFMSAGGTILFHDIDYKDGVPTWLDDHYGPGKWENVNGKIGRVRK